MQENQENHSVDNLKKDNVEKGKKISEKRETRKKAKKISDIGERTKKLKNILIIMLLFLLILYFVLRIAYETGRFTVVLDSSSDMKGALVMYANKNEKLTRRTLQADVLDFMTNISGDWIPENINDEADGGHNGENYIAYTFYIENMADETIHYWYRIYIDDIVRNVDKAIRVAVYLNGEKTVYAKANSRTSEPEKDTVAFKDEENVMLVQRRDFKSKDVDKFTVVIWVEGDDPDCIDDLIGGEMKMHMTITEEHIKQE
ncbi:MAG: hypothetical protein IKG56_02710 [Clostridia bacterium]|nr:hypothetical protein [Clostridia bacterium]